MVKLPYKAFTGSILTIQNGILFIIQSSCGVNFCYDPVTYITISLYLYNETDTQ